MNQPTVSQEKEPMVMPVITVELLPETDIITTSKIELPPDDLTYG